MKIPNLILAAVLGATLPAVAALAQGGYNIYLTAKENAGMPLQEPAKTFSCSDKIYAVVEVSQPDGQHTLHATWRNPSGEDQEVTKYDFQVTNGYARIWVWLKLQRSGEAAIVQFMNPSAGMDEFVGDWELDIQVDGERVGKQSFEVLC